MIKFAKTLLETIKDRLTEYQKFRTNMYARNSGWE